MIRGYCAHAISTSPLDLAQEIMSPPKFPIAGQAHHPLVAAVLVTAWRNAALEEASGRVEARYYPAGSRAAHQPRLTVIEEVA